MSVREFALVKKGKDCVALAEILFSDITQGCVDDVDQKLKDLKGDAEKLAKHAEEKAKEIEEVEKQYLQKIEKIQRKIGELGCHEEELKGQKRNLEASLSGKQLIQSQMSNTLSNAESELKAAENKVSEAKREAESRVGGGAALGAVIGTLLAPGLGTLFGAAFGAGGGGLLNILIDEEKAARNRVDDCRRRHNDAQADVSSASSAIYNVQSQINSLSSQCQSLERQRLQYNEEVKKMKKAVKFFREAAMFWKEFQHISKDGADRTALLQKIVSKAKEEYSEDLSWLDSNASKIIGKSFLDAWVMIETKCKQGAEFVFRIEE